MPFPKNDGGAYSIYSSSLSLLSQDIELKILSMDLQSYPGDWRKIPPDFISRTSFETVKVDNRVKVWAACLNLFRGTSYFIERFYSAAFSKKLTQILQNQEFDIIQLEHLYVCLYLPVIRKYSNARIVLRAQNVESSLWEAYYRRLSNPIVRWYLSVATKRLEAFEKNIVSKLDGIIALTPHDRLFFTQYAGTSQVTDIPIGVDTESLGNSAIGPLYQGLPLVYHLGSMDWKPNIQGMKWFVKEVLPLVKAQNPQIKIIIAGKNMPAWFFRRSDTQFIVEGTVEDALKFQEDKAILIVPLLTGSGIRVKILEAMAMGKTVISTSIGAAGIPGKNGEHLFIADQPEAFAAQIIRCAESLALCQKIGSTAATFARYNFELHSIGGRMIAFYSSLVSAPKSKPE
jgi:glycosyltransferase involved in cell wall biosynthesis